MDLDYVGEVRRHVYRGRPGEALDRPEPLVLRAIGVRRHIGRAGDDHWVVGPTTRGDPETHDGTMTQREHTRSVDVGGVGARATVGREDGDLPQPLRAWRLVEPRASSREGVGSERGRRELDRRRHERDFDPEPDQRDERRLHACLLYAMRRAHDRARAAPAPAPLAIPASVVRFGHAVSARNACAGLESSPRATDEAGMHRQVLLVEHDRRVALALERTLLQAGDRVVARATRSSDALTKATTVAADVILFDLAIPDGLIGLAALRAATDIPIVLIADPADAELPRVHGRCVPRGVAAPELAVAIELVCR
jgi:CheY-like chemotaxis protein